VESLITCPKCNHARVERIPEDSCLYFYECVNCHSIMRPRPGECCVFCSYGTVKCSFECGMH
jgi:hypothetical protein